MERKETNKNYSWKKQRLYLLDKHFKLAILNMLKELKKTLDKKQKKQGEQCLHRDYQ